MRIGKPVFSPNQFGGKRQTIAQGRLDSLGFPNSITTASGLSVTINAATAPLRANFAAGFDNLPIDFSGTFASDQVFSALTASITHFFYLERDLSTGVLSAARIAIAPVYGRVAPTAPATGLHWFKTSEDSLTSQPGMTMYEWSGTVWVARQRVFLGEVTTGASAVTSIANYAYNRQYLSDWLTVSVNNTVNFLHNFGAPPADLGATLTFYGRINASDANPGFAPYGFYVDASTSYGIQIRNAGGRLGQIFQMGTAAIYISGSWLTTCQIRCAINSP